METMVDWNVHKRASCRKLASMNRGPIDIGHIASSSPGLLSCDVMYCCGRIATFHRSVQHDVITQKT